MREGFHDAFVAAMAGDECALASWVSGPAAAGLSVHRNSLSKGAADALVAQFPTVERVVGQAWLAAAAAAHAVAHPPRHASLLTYGQAFPDWLGQFSPAASMPFLVGLARLDLLWTEAHLAADQDPLDPAEVAGLAPEAFAARTLDLHPATRFAGFHDTTPQLWRALQPPNLAPAGFELETRCEGLLIVRPGLDIAHRVIGPGAMTFLAACRNGGSLTAAAAAALMAEPDLDLSDTFESLLAIGAFSTLRTLS